MGWRYRWPVIAGLAMTISNVLLIAAIICFALAAIGLSSRINLIGLGLAFFAASFLV